MNRFEEMFKYGNFQKRIVITFIEYMITSIIWIIIDQYMTYCKRKYKISNIFIDFNDCKNNNQYC